jgi:signal transduction histidine kinase
MFKSSKKNNLLSNTSVYWLAAFIFLLIPSIYVIFLLNSTIQRESDALRSEIRESYKITLISTANELNKHWQKIETDPSFSLEDSSEILNSTGADSVIIYDKNGRMIFPLVDDSKGTLNFAFSHKYQQALELQKAHKYEQSAIEFENLIKMASNQMEEAIALYGAAEAYLALKQIEKASILCNKLIFMDRYKDILDSEGNSLALNAEIIFLQIEPQKSNKFNSILAKLITLLSDYENKKVSTKQRIELSTKLNLLFPDIYLPLAQAEKIATQFLSENPNPDRRNILQKAQSIPYWQYTARGRNTLIYSKENLQYQLLTLIELADIPDKTMIRLVSPEDKNTDAIVSIAASSRMPGWRISLNFIDPFYMKTLIEERIKIYRLTAILVIGFSLFLSLFFLKDMKRRVQLADLKNNLVANVTHELKTPLASTRILLDTLIQHDNMPREKTLDYLNHLSAENNRLCNLVEHFLTFSKIDKKQYNFQFCDTSLDQLIEELEEAINGRFFKDRKRVTIDCSDLNVYFSIDSQALITVILNLIENGLKFSNEKQKVCLSINTNKTDIHFSVTDEGIGIDSTEQGSIYKRFFQTDSKLNKQHDGCGLGLSIVKTVLKAHHSKIHLVSEPNKGSTFSFSLPIQQG